MTGNAPLDALDAATAVVNLGCRHQAEVSRPPVMILTTQAGPARRACPTHR